MSSTYEESLMATIVEQMRMSMPALCDALSVTTVVTHGDPVTSTLDLDLSAASAIAVLGVSGSINASMMVTLLEGASPDIADSETLVAHLDDAIDAMSQVLDSDIATPAAASGHPTIEADISVPLVTESGTVGAVLVFLAPREEQADDTVNEPSAAHEAAAAPMPAAAPTPTASPAPAAASGATAVQPKQIDALAGVQMEVTIEIGRTKLPVGDLLQLQPGQVLELDREVGAPLDMYINGTLLARGEIVVLEDHFGFRVTAVVSQD